MSFLDQALNIQRAIRIIQRLPEQAKWQLVATDEDGLEDEGEDGEEMPKTFATLSIMVPEGDTGSTRAMIGGLWERQHLEDGSQYWWRSDGDLEISVEAL